MYNFDFLLDLGFDKSDLEWFECHAEGVLQHLYENHINQVSRRNMYSLVETGFHKRTVLSLWMTYPYSFEINETLFNDRIKVLTQNIREYQLNSYYWKNGELSVFEELGVSEDSVWKDALKELKKEINEDNLEIIVERMGEAGFEKEDVEEAFGNISESILAMIADFYLEPRYLEKLQELLDVGMHENLLLYMFIDSPDCFWTDVSEEVMEKRLESIEDVWDMYDTYGEAFIEAFLADNENVWQKFLEINA